MKPLEYRSAMLDIASEVEALSSPSGHMSKAARKRAQDRLNAKFAALPPIEREVMTNAKKAGFMRTAADRLRGFAEGGFKPRAHKREAERIEARIAELLTDPNAPYCWRPGD